ncbi:hypothetical protein DPMN_083996 [Dreissena polymorpha]|uniref:Uncharacterized protein n=1 Tax=Dreissena polymorpha TaxID=45954 RepID=A0A9D4BBN4_DREPO|nr:hypothetical protein DPMN_083996 [Dreissena polymorpha]
MLLLHREKRNNTRLCDRIDFESQEIHINIRLTKDGCAFEVRVEIEKKPLPPTLKDRIPISVLRMMLDNEHDDGDDNIFYVENDEDDDDKKEARPEYSHKARTAEEKPEETARKPGRIKGNTEPNPRPKPEHCELDDRSVPTNTASSWQGRGNTHATCQLLCMRCPDLGQMDAHERDE